MLSPNLTSRNSHGSFHCTRATADDWPSGRNDALPSLPSLSSPLDSPTRTSATKLTASLVPAPSSPLSPLSPLSSPSPPTPLASVVTPAGRPYPTPRSKYQSPPPSHSHSQSQFQSNTDPYLRLRALTPGNSHSSHNFQASGGSNIMLMTTQLGQAQGNLQRPQTLENLQLLQTPSFRIQFHQLQQQQHHHQQLQVMQQQYQEQRQQQQLQQKQQQQLVQPSVQAPPPPTLLQEHRSHQHQQQLQLQIQQLQLRQQQEPLDDVQMAQQHPQLQTQLPIEHRLQHQHQQHRLLERQCNPFQQRTLHQQQQHGLPLALSMSFEPNLQHQGKSQQQRDELQQKRGRFQSWSASSTPLTPLSADVPSLPILSMNELGQPLYIDPQQYQHQLLQQHIQQQHIQQHTQYQSKQKYRQQPSLPAATPQTVTPDQFLGSGFDWVTGMSDLGIPTSSKGSHSRAATDSGTTPPTSVSDSSSRNNSASEFLSAVAAASIASVNCTTAISLSNAVSANLDMPLLKTEISNITQTRFASGSAAFTNDSALFRAGPKGTGAEGPKSACRRRSKAQNDASITASASTAAQSAMAAVKVENKRISGSAQQSAQPPTPHSPITSFPESRVLHQSLHRSSISVKQEMPEIEYASNVSSTDPLATATSVSALSASSLLPELFPVPTSGAMESVFDQHHRVLSTTSHGSRGNGWEALSGSSDTRSSVPKSVTHARCPSSNNSNDTIVSSLSVQSAPCSEGLSAAFDSSFMVNDGHLADVSQLGTSTKGSSSTHANLDTTNLTIKLEANIDMDAIAINNTESPTAREGEDVDSDADNTRPATCPHCSKEFQSKGLLRSHIVSHSSDRPFVCWDCTDKSYKRNHDLLRHRREKHNVDGMTIPSRGSSRSHVAEPSGTCEGGSVRTPHQATVASQSRVPHQEILYSNHGMMYFGNRGALSSLPSSSSGSPLDPHGGIEYGQHHRHGNPLLVPHTPNVGLGLGLELGIFGAKDFMGGFSSMTGGASTSSTSLITTKRKRKLSNLNSSTTPQVSSASMMIPLPNPVVPFETSGTQFTTTTNVSLVLRPPQQLSTLPGAFEGLDANMGHFGSGGI